MPNYDEKTGIRYGVISPHTISQYALDDIYSSGTDPYYESGKTELMDDLKSFCESHNLNYERMYRDDVFQPFIDEYTEDYPGNEDGTMDYSDKEYDLHVSGDNFGIFVMKSPYYTMCRGCSPCAPGAGDLNSPYTEWPDMDQCDKALCLGPEWFNEESPMPYRVFRIDNDQEVI